MEPLTNRSLLLKKSLFLAEYDDLEPDLEIPPLLVDLPLEVWEEEEEPAPRKKFLDLEEAFAIETIEARADVSDYLRNWSAVSDTDLMGRRRNSAKGENTTFDLKA